MKTCPVEGCQKPKRRPNGNGYCEMHYTRLRTHGSTDARRRSPSERFWAKVEKTEGCWNWTAGKIAHGYGNFRVGDAWIRAHRFSYEHAYGPIDAALVIDHKCHNTACVRPDHLRAVTQKQNTENRRGPQVNNNSSGIRGVSWHKSTRKWLATVQHNNHHYYVGVFTDLDEADAAVTAKRLELFTCNELDRRQQQQES